MASPPSASSSAEDPAELTREREPSRHLTLRSRGSVGPSGPRPGDRKEPPGGPGTTRCDRALPRSKTSFLKAALGLISHTYMIKVKLGLFCPKPL